MTFLLFSWRIELTPLTLSGFKHLGTACLTNVFTFSPCFLKGFGSEIGKEKSGSW